MSTIDLRESKVYRFGDFELDASTRQLRRSGRVVSIQPKPFDLLLYLIRHRDRVVSREELLAELCVASTSTMLRCDLRSTPCEGTWATTATGRR